MRRRFQGGGPLSDPGVSESDAQDDTTTTDVTAGELPVSGTGGTGLSALDMPGAEGAMKLYVKSSQEARDVLKRAREQILARKYSQAIPLLQISAALGAPTRTGRFGENLGRASQALANSLAGKQAFEQQQQQQATGIDTQLAGLDEKTAMAQLQLAELRAKLANEANKVPNQLVKVGDHYEWRSPAQARQPGTEAPGPKAPAPEFHQFTMGLPDGTQQVGILDVRSGKVTPFGDPYRPIAKLSGNAMVAAQSKLGTVAILRSQLQQMRDRWEKIKNDPLSVGAGRGWTPTTAGREFDKSVDLMRGTIRGLTRIPGEGSMSDWEGKLDQAKLPSRGEWGGPEVVEDNMNMLENLINGYELTTRGMLGQDTSPYIAALMKGEKPFAIQAPPVVPPKKNVQPPSSAPATTPSAAPPSSAVQAPPSAQPSAGPNSAPPPGANPDDYQTAVAPPEALETLKANPTARTKAQFLKTFGYLPEGYSWDAATRGEYVKRYKELPSGYD